MHPNVTLGEIWVTMTSATVMTMATMAAAGWTGKMIHYLYPHFAVAVVVVVVVVAAVVVVDLHTSLQ